MARTTQCPECQTLLNLPELAEPKRLKCPKCGTRFYSDGSAAAGPKSGTPASHRPGSSSAQRPASSGQGSIELPIAAGDLAETFGADLLMGEDTTSRPPSGSRKTAEAAGLFDESGAPRRRVSAAEARRQARRCPSCSTVVPAGMSLCSRCGLDLDTGKRDVADHLFDDEPAPVITRSGPPIGITLIGGLTLMTSLILGIFAITKLGISFSSAEGLGGLCFALICAFGVFASFEFLRGKSVKLLMIALALGGAMDIIVLIAMPVYQANVELPVEHVTGQKVKSTAEVDIDVVIEGPQQRLMNNGGYQKIMWGIGILLAGAAMFVYLSTAGVRKHFEKPRFAPPLPIP